LRLSIAKLPIFACSASSSNRQSALGNRQLLPFRSFSHHDYAAVRPGVPEGPRRLLRRYVESGRLGVKTGRGFYEAG